MQHIRDKHVRAVNRSDVGRVVRCPYCDDRAQFMRSSEPIYGTDYGPMWACLPCEAWVGCHGQSGVPKGRLANKTLRELKQRAHAEFDPIWQRGYVGRSFAYRILSDRLGIPPAQCHIGMMDEAQCQRVIDLCQTLGPELSKLRFKREQQAAA